MIIIRIVEAKNLPIYNNHLRKTIISCFSSSSDRYFYGSFKNKKKTTNPQWNSEISIELFRLIDLTFSLYGYRYSKDNFLIGNVDINFVQFLSKSPGNQILNNTETPYQQNFPITSCNSPNATLSLSFIFSPFLYRPIEFNPWAYTNTTINIWATYSPSPENGSNPVEIELFQAFYFQSKNKFNEFGIFYNLTKEISWQTIGKSSLGRYFLGETGLSQIHSIPLSKLNGKYTLFILNVLNYTGKVTLNFVTEKRGKTRVFENMKYMKPKRKHPKIGIINSIEFDVQSNKKICLPFYLFYKINSSNSYSYEFNEYGSGTPIIFDKSTVTNYYNLNYSDRISSEILFNSQIIESMHSIPKIENVHFLRTNILPINEPLSLLKTLKDYGLSPDLNLRIYVSGCQTIATQNGTFHNYWNQRFIIYDKNTGKKCSDMSELFRTTQIDECSCPVSSSSFLPISFKCNFIQTLDLNEFDKDKILVYFIYSCSPLGSSYPPGFFLISQCVNRKETLLFYNPIVTDVMKSHYAVCFRIEYIENEWLIVPMKRFFKDQRQMICSVDSARLNNWNWNDNLGFSNNRNLGLNSPKNPESEFLLNDSRSDNLNI